METHTNRCHKPFPTKLQTAKNEVLCILWPILREMSIKNWGIMGFLDVEIYFSEFDLWENCFRTKASVPIGVKPCRKYKMCTRTIKNLNKTYNYYKKHMLFKFKRFIMFRTQIVLHKWIIFYNWYHSKL